MQGAVRVSASADAHEQLAKLVLLFLVHARWQLSHTQAGRETSVIDLNEVKVTPRDHEVLNLLVQGCSNKDIAGQLNISPRTVKQHLRTLFLRAGIRDGRKRVKLAIAMYAKEGGNS